MGTLVILTVGVMLCNMKVGVNEEQIDGKRIKGISATVGKFDRRQHNSFHCDKCNRTLLLLIIPDC